MLFWDPRGESEVLEDAAGAWWAALGVFWGWAS